MGEQPAPAMTPGQRRLVEVFTTVASGVLIGVALVVMLVVAGTACFELVRFYRWVVRS